MYSQPDYEEADFSYLIANSSATYETDTLQYELPSDSCELSSISPYELAESMEAEQQIYETPYEDEENYGPIYSAPSSDEQQIYEEFEGKRFRKLYHREIKYVWLCIIVNVCIRIYRYIDIYHSPTVIIMTIIIATAVIFNCMKECRCCT